MNVEAAPLPPPVIVLLVADDHFERSYVGTVLAARGVGILGPFAHPLPALAAIATTTPDAAVMAWSGDPAAGQPLSDELVRRAIPCLTVTQVPMPATDTDSRLTRPFAAFQVAEWVSAAITPRPAAD